MRDKRTGKIRWGYLATINGHKYQRTGFLTEKDADTALAALKFKGALQSLGALPDPPAVLSLAKLVDSYCEDARSRGVQEATLENTLRVVKRFQVIVGQDAMVDEITSDHLRLYRAERLAANTHPHTVGYELKRLQSLFRAARRLHEHVPWIPPPIPGVQSLHQGREIALTTSQIEALKAAATPELRDFIEVSLHTMLRIREVGKISRMVTDFTQGLDSDYGRLLLIAAKTHKQTSLPLTAGAAEILKRRFESGDVAFPESYHNLRRAFIRACEKAKIPYGLPDGVVPHTLRHSSASYLADLGVPLHVIQRLTRHSTTHMLMRYTHPSAREVRSAMDKLSERGDLPLSSPKKKRA